MKNLILICAVFATALIGSNATASDNGQAFLIEDGAHIHVEFRAPNMLRISDSSGDGYMLMRDNKLYIVVDDAEQVMVLDVVAAAAAYGDAFAQDTVWNEEIREIIDFKKTNNRENIAGIQGEEFVMTFVDGNGDRQTQSMVMSRDAKVVALTRTMHEMSKILLRASGGELPQSVVAMEQLIIDEGWGLLKQGTEFQLAMITADAPQVTRFNLPAEPMALSAAEHGSGDTNAMEQFLAQKAERQKNRQSSKVEQAVDRATDRALDKAVERTLGRIFN
ncbi:MAG: hypothetical protein LAT77_07495 [Aliidiomarina sp.]|uniref:hypothetical protein n=1 Tax=Aliidiomarina sp. TaxID=1872439 RepID=UPI0025C0A861|nr:hypothetical protein [Aliidiomarina sp.]MCH8501738.1 hypothetical protein [Aliidiomarina sp.]